MDTIINLLDTYGVLLLFGIILVKEAGIPLPVPGDLLLIVVGARAATGQLSVWEVLLASFVAGVIGAFIYYLMARGPARGLIYRYGKYAGLTPVRLDKASGALQGRGWPTIAVGRAVPGLRLGTVAASGLAGVPVRTFLTGLAVGTALFVTSHIMLGYFLGPAIMEFMDSVEIPIWAVLLALAVLGLVGWFLIKMKNRRATSAGRAEGITAPILEWADACCPACLAAGRLMRDRET